MIDAVKSIISRSVSATAHSMKYERCGWSRVTSGLQLPRTPASRATTTHPSPYSALAFFTASIIHGERKIRDHPKKKTAARHDRGFLHQAISGRSARDSVPHVVSNSTNSDRQGIVAICILPPSSFREMIFAAAVGHQLPMLRLQEQCLPG
jgi:hypothetical protein